MHRIAHTTSHEIPAGNRKSRRLGLAGLLLIMLGGLLLTPVLRPRSAGAATTLASWNFDNMPAGKVPTNWTSMVSYGGSPPPFMVSRQESSSAPQALRHEGLDKAGWSRITAPMLTLPADAAGEVELTFRHKYNLEKSSTGYCNDGGLLMFIPNGSGSEADWRVIYADEFISGGYTARINSGANHYVNKSAWCGDSGGWVTTRVRLPEARNNFQLSWRAGFDGNTSAGAWTIDDVQITYRKKPAMTFVATKADGTPYRSGETSNQPVTVTARCVGDGQPLALFKLSTSDNYQTQNTSGAAITAPTFTKDGLNQFVDVGCEYAGGYYGASQRFQVRIIQSELTVTMFGPAQAGTNSLVRLNAAVSNIGTRTSPAAFDLITKVPAGLGVPVVMAPPQASCTTGAPTSGFRTVTCRIASLAPNASVYIPMDVRVAGADGDEVQTEVSVTPSFPDRPANNRNVLVTSITGGQVDLVMEMNAFSGIQPNMDNEVELRLFNRGTVDLSAGTARIVLPAGLTYAGTYEPDACTAAGQVLTCTFWLTVHPGESDHISMLVRPAVANGTNLTIQAQADAANLVAESNETNNGATMNVVVGGGPARS
jgi:hypothetical protein